ncbi:MAG TPA: helix-turn-helix transcriptional regulator [Micromonosporaceae bacterium]|nr:helix-turn-helix transcriptional regulator [Micromonosporaceae bacterium]
MNEHIGERVRYWRRRRGGMSQRTLAGLAGVSQGFISQVETGVQSIDRRSTLVALAAALQITVADLIGEPGDPTDPNRAQAARSVPDIRLALAEVDAQDAGPASRSQDEVRAVLAQADAFRVACDYARSGPILPGLLRDAASHEPALRGEVLHQVATFLRSVGYRDLAWRASDMALSAAREAEDMTLLGAVQFARLKCLPPEASGVIARQARRTYEELQPHTADPGVRRGYGALHLMAAFVEASANDTGNIQAHLDEARAEADTLGEPAYAGGLTMAFGPTNVGLWAMGSALELAEHHRVVEIAKTVDPDGVPNANRQSTYWLDYGRALAHLGRDHEAIGALARAESKAPQHVKMLPAARSTVASMIGRARHRAVADDLRRLADKMGLASTG